MGDVHNNRKPNYDVGSIWWFSFPEKECPAYSIVTPRPVLIVAPHEDKSGYIQVIPCKTDRSPNKYKGDLYFDFDGIHSKCNSTNINLVQKNEINNFRGTLSNEKINELKKLWFINFVLKKL